MAGSRPCRACGRRCWRPLHPTPATAGSVGWLLLQDVRARLLHFRASGRPALRERDRGVLASCFQPRAMRSEDASLLKGWRAAAVVLSCMGYAWCTRGHVRGSSNRTTGTGWPWRYHNPYESLQTTGTWFATPTRRSPANPRSATGFHCQLKIVVSPVRFRVSPFRLSPAQRRFVWASNTPRKTPDRTDFRPRTFSGPIAPPVTLLAPRR
jgi:hypothetical protein